MLKSMWKHEQREHKKKWTPWPISGKQWASHEWWALHEKEDDGFHISSHPFEMTQPLFATCKWEKNKRIV
jgi:hypothetical protein